MDDDLSASYIHMVHHLIEECLIFNMSKEECMKSLSKHANIKPVITSTVWNELAKENKEFFEAYNKKRRDVSTSVSDGKSLSDTSDFNLIGSGGNDAVFSSVTNGGATMYDVVLKGS